MTRIRKGSNLIATGQLLGRGNQEASGVVDYKAVFNSIRSRVCAAREREESNGCVSGQRGVSAAASAQSSGGLDLNRMAQPADNGCSRPERRRPSSDSDMTHLKEEMEEEAAVAAPGKRRKVSKAGAAAGGARKVEEVVVAPVKQDICLRWSPDSGLSSHVKRPRTPHQGRTFGGGARKRSCVATAHAKPNEDNSSGLRNCEHPGLPSPSEKMKGLDSAVLEHSQRSDARGSSSVTKKDGDLADDEIGLDHKLEEGRATEPDHPSNQPEGSLMHSLYLVYLAAGRWGLTIREAVTEMGMQQLPGLHHSGLTRHQIGEKLESNPYFVELEEGKFFLCSSLPDVEKSCEVKAEPECEEVVKDEEMSLDSLRKCVQKRSRSLSRARPAKRYVKSGDRSCDSESTEKAKDSDVDFDTRDPSHGEASGATTVGASGEDSPQPDPADPSSHTGSVGSSKKYPWRHLVDSLTKADKKVGKQCARTDGRRWQCPLRARSGHSLCAHHLSKFRLKKVYAALQRRARVEGLRPSKEMTLRTSSTPGPKPRTSTRAASKSRSATPPKEAEDTDNIAYSVSVNSRGQRKTVKNRSIMSMY